MDRRRTIKIKEMKMRVEMAGMEVMEEMVADVTPKTNNSALKALEMCAALSMSPSVGRSP